MGLCYPVLRLCMFLAVLVVVKLLVKIKLQFIMYHYNMLSNFFLELIFFSQNINRRNPAIEKNHLVKLLRQQLLASRRAVAPHAALHSRIPTAADVPTLLGFGPFSLLNCECCLWLL